MTNKKTTKKIVKKSSNIKKDEKKSERPQNKHLTPGGPGRPKGKLNFDTRVDMAIEFLANQYVAQHNAKKENKKKQITRDDVDIEGDIFAQLLQKARGGNEKMIDSFLDRRHGKAKQTFELGGIDGDPIKHEVKVIEAKEKAKGMLSKWLGKK